MGVFSQVWRWLITPVYVPMWVLPVTVFAIVFAMAAIVINEIR